MAGNDGSAIDNIDSSDKAEIEISEKHLAFDDVEAAGAVASDLTAAGRIQFHDHTGVSNLHPRYLEERGRDGRRSHVFDDAEATEELGPGFADESGDVGGHGYNDTTVDIIAVPCPGADPVQTWIYDHDSSTDSLFPARSASFMSRSIRNSRSDPGSRHGSRHGSQPGSQHGSQHDSHHGSHNSLSSSTRRASPWVTYKLRERVNGTARVFLYRHRCLAEGMTLKTLSNDLLEQVLEIRKGKTSRPLFFIAHSIGGLVVKNALVRASQKTKFQEIMDDCHGVTFFGTPHRGSSYMSMPNLKLSIRDLLQLEAPLPSSLAHEIHVNDPALLELHSQFVDIASELRLWSFYETQECLLSGTGDGFSNEVQFTAPLVSVKSAILDLWQEDPLGIDCDHARLASFGNNEEILASYLGDLAGAIQKAEELSTDHHPLRLKANVQVEVIGFYDDTTTAQQYADQDQDQDAQAGSIIRLYATKYPFKDFLRKGPEKCLSERLHDRSKRNKRRNRSPHRHASKSDLRSAAREGEVDIQGLGIGAPQGASAPHGAGTFVSPEIVVTSGSERPRLLRVPAQTAHDFRPGSPESAASAATASTTMSDPVLVLGREYAGDGPLTEDRLAKQQAEIDYMLKEHAAGFSRPDPALRKFTWVHMPFNNPVWVKDIFFVLSRTQGHDFSRLFDYDNWQSKHIQNRHSDTQPAFMKATCKYISTDRISSPRPTPLFGPVSNVPNCLYLYLPYLHFDTYRGMIERRKLIKKRRERGRAKPVPGEVAEKESLELKAIWEYIGFDPPLNCRRTLDQFGHHSLRDTNSRDDDQMLYKLTKKDPFMPGRPGKKHSGPSPDGNVSSVFSNKGTGTAGSVGSTSDDDGSDSDSDEAELKEGYVLMVDQLWLWSIDTNTLATFFPRRHSTPSEGTLFHQADLRNSVYNELNGDLTGRTENSLDLAALIVWHAVTVLLERSSHPDLEIFRLFDEAIGMLAERMTLNMKQFRTQALNLDSGDDEESDDSDYEGESPASIKRRHRRELLRSEMQNRENTSALLELGDLKDELTTLQKLFDLQTSTIQEMKKIYTSRDLKEITKNGQYYLNEALEYLDDFKLEVTEMLKRVDITRNDYEKMLEMVQRQAQVDEVRWSRLQAELASSQNLSTMIFTTFTVIFLPLTFFTGLFGMNTVEWAEAWIPVDDDGPEMRRGGMPDLKMVGLVSLPASALLIIASLVCAFSWRVQRAFKTTYKTIKGSWKFTKKFYAERFESSKRKDRKKRKKLEKKRRRMEMEADGHKDYDFWDMVKKQQTNIQYQIPSQNRKADGQSQPLIKRRT
ncbi:hypothetical protein QBC38DRAFT_453291 [Podospora fimiseda]|uniref:DUF676 domain-containing protein n=1 Tax=Podospora fimiseda TaxID=252190 RepID=A0AAN7BTT5_9PEZI|nr:hypothetical protein QBC38DRAFT_453291 [Podospora fimiseda]